MADGFSSCVSSLCDGLIVLLESLWEMGHPACVKMKIDRRNGRSITCLREGWKADVGHGLLSCIDLSKFMPYLVSLFCKYILRNV